MESRARRPFAILFGSVCVVVFDAYQEAYVLFYEDIVKAGNTKSVEELPPPPLSRGQQQHGGEQVDDGLTLRNRTFETGSRFWKVDRWEYEIRDAGPKAAIMPSSETVPARERILCDAPPTRQIWSTV